MTRYEIVLYVHIVAAIAWVGGGTMMQFFGLRVLGAGGERLAAFALDVEWIGSRVLTPASLLALASGIFMVVDGPWTFGTDWIVVALVLFAITMVAGAAFFGPESGRIGAIIRDRSVESPEAKRRVRRLILLSRLDLVLLYLLVYDMAVKPEITDAVAVLLGLGGALIAAAAVSWRSLAGQGAGEPAAAPAE